MGLLKFQCMTPRRKIRQQKILEIAAEIKESSLEPEFGWEGVDMDAVSVCGGLI